MAATSHKLALWPRLTFLLQALKVHLALQVSMLDEALGPSWEIGHVLVQAVTTKDRLGSSDNRHCSLNPGSWTAAIRSQCGGFWWWPLLVADGLLLCPHRWSPSWVTLMPRLTLIFPISWHHLTGGFHMWILGGHKHWVHDRTFLFISRISV
jgi:hypothetical protein